jgi:hypothetical protein
MKLVVKVNDTEYVLSSEQLNALCTVLFDAEVFQREYLGASVPEDERWLDTVAPPGTGAMLKADVWSDTKYEALVAAYKMRQEQKRK